MSKVVHKITHGNSSTVRLACGSADLGDKASKDDSEVTCEFCLKQIKKNDGNGK